MIGSQVSPAGHFQSTYMYISEVCERFSRNSMRGKIDYLRRLTVKKRYKGEK